MKISVIVPVYNVEEYLERCLNSLVNQTLKDIEIIVVNDGSPDNSQKIIDKYVKKYKNVKSYIKKNGGLSDARNYGLKYATGEYISFIDSDDYVDETMMEKMYNKAISNDYDLVVCNLEMVDGQFKLIKKVFSNLEYDINSVEEIRKYMLVIYSSAVNKIYKRSLFDEKVRFKKGVWFEDVEFIYRLIPYIKSIGCVKEHLYYYVQREGSITKTFDERIFSHIYNWNGLVDYYKKNGFYNKYYDELEYSYVRYLYASFIKQASNYKDKSQYNKAVNVAIENVKKTFPKYRKNKYFYKSFKGVYLLLFNKLFAEVIYIIRRR